MALPEHPVGAEVAPWLMGGIAYALRHVERVGPVRVLLLVPELVVDAVPAVPWGRPARVTLQVPDTIACELRDQDTTDRDVYALVRVPRSALERSASRLVLPGERGRS